jgi:hypothetical protein
MDRAHRRRWRDRSSGDSDPPNLLRGLESKLPRTDDPGAMRLPGSDRANLMVRFFGLQAEVSSAVFRRL